MQYLRLFIALEVPRAVQKSLEKSFEKLPLHESEFRRIPSENLHITIKFLGSTSVDDISEIINILNDVGDKSTSPEITIKQPMLLPAARPKAISLAIQPSDYLSALYTELELQLAQAGMAHPEHRRFNPHITVARMKSKLSEHDAEHIKNWNFTSSFAATTLTLFESVLKPEGPAYTPLTQFSLL